jgi:hypothetical protein
LLSTEQLQVAVVKSANKDVTVSLRSVPYFTSSSRHGCGLLYHIMGSVGLPLLPSQHGPQNPCRTNVLPSSNDQGWL